MFGRASGALTIIQDLAIPLLQAKRKEKQSRRRSTSKEEGEAQAKKKEKHKQRRRRSKEEGEAQAKKKEKARQAQAKIPM
jgi:hypothetical protein